MQVKENTQYLQRLTLITAIAITALASIKIAIEALFPAYSPILVEPSSNILSLVFVTLYKISPYLASIAWATFLLTLLWKGRTRSLWKNKGYDYDTFRVVAKMRGSNTRINILKSLQTPKNRYQLANELGIHWESVDSHIDILLRHDLVKEVISLGIAKYLLITEKGKKVLELLDNSNVDSR